MAARFLTEFSHKVKSILPRKKKVEDFYDVKEIIGRGNYSVVKRAVHKKTDEEVALKIIQKEPLNEDETENLWTEIEILRAFGGHPNIVSLKEVFEDRRRLILVLEFLKGGELLQQMRTRGAYQEQEARTVIQKILVATAFLHKNGVVHRDLKPENMLFSNDGPESELKVADFGFAKYIGDGGLFDPCGSPIYVAPEIVNEEKYDQSVDVWSIGVILYLLLCGFPPFYSENVDRIFSLIAIGKFNFPDPYWTNISASAKQLVTLMLKTNPKERITAEEALRHPFIIGQNPPISNQFEDKEDFKNLIEKEPKISEKEKRRRSKKKKDSRENSLRSQNEERKISPRNQEEKKEIELKKEKKMEERKLKENKRIDSKEIPLKIEKAIKKKNTKSELTSSSDLSEDSFDDE
eukprot:TRINITY_DN78_c0_g1_i1.p1 TRINITY_DN78_c0_g1~~TRINITY_DN78_c0_g1_i1.p1  ORF type:complete len:407 (+),score=134.07 TRINITY_DN78_c0_g1_i1:164-1384(+)